MALRSTLDPALEPTAAVPRPPEEVAASQAATSPILLLRRRALRPGDLLQLQRTCGNRTLQRLLRHRQAALVQREDDKPATPAEDAAAQADLDRRRAAARDSLLAAAQRDGAMYMASADSLDDKLREPLYEDGALTAGLRGTFHGLSLMIARMRVRYHLVQPSWVRHFTQAVRDHDTGLISDLLRGYPGLHDPQMGVVEVLEAELGGDPSLPELRRLAQEPSGPQSQVSSISQSAKYEPATDRHGQPQPGQPPTLIHHIPRVRYILQRTGGELRVIVRIRFVRANPASPGVPQTTSPPAAKLNDWRSGIEDAWNHRFVVGNDTTRLRLVFVPIFNADELAHYELTYVDGEGQSNTGEKGEWYSSATGTVIAHEFGHMIGNPDEYDLPAKPEDIPDEFKLSPEEKKRSSYESVTGQAAPHPEGGMGKSGNAVRDSMMSDYGRVQGRHVWPVLEHFNASPDLKPADEPEFKLVVGAS